MSGSITGVDSAARVVSTAQQPRLAGDFGTFLTLLTTQLRNQSPTDPLDANQMTAQLVQFASVEQQIAMNQNLRQLLALEQSAMLMAATPLMGRTVEVESDSLALQDGVAELRLAPAGAAVAAHVVVLGSAGQVLKEEVVRLGSGRTDWRWDGRDTSGESRPDGAYRVAVAGLTPSGDLVPLDFAVRGRATALERRDGQVQLLLGALAVGFDRVRSIDVASP